MLTSASGHGGARLASFTGVLRGTVPHTPNLLIQSGDQTLVTPGGRFAPPPLVLHGTDATASADGAQVAYLRGDTLYAARADGGGERRLATGIAPPPSDLAGPVWSPDGTRLVVASGSSLLLVATDGSGSHTLVTGANQSVNPSWSPDGATIAFERNDSGNWQVWTVGADGRDARELIGGTEENDRFPRFSPVSSRLVYISDRRHLRGGTTRYRYALYLRDELGTTHELVDDVHPATPPSWSPTAAQIAVAAGQECRRWGIYVVGSFVGSRRHRISNLCRFDGTPGSDAIHGSQFFDLVRGFGGNDAIEAGAGDDVVFGGSGDDRVFGGAGNDLVIGGNGRDRIDCGPGNDTVEGAGPLDRIARDCEHVRR